MVGASSLRIVLLFIYLLLHYTLFSINFKLILQKRACPQLAKTNLIINLFSFWTLTFPVFEIKNTAYNHFHGNIWQNADQE